MTEATNKEQLDEKSAVDIAAAANAAIEIATIAVDFIPGGKAVKLVAGVKKYAPAAKRDLGQNLGPRAVQEGVRCTRRRSARGYSGSSAKAA